MANSSNFTTLMCKGCASSLMDLDEMLLMFDYIRNHGSNHFHIKAIERLVNHYSETCPKFNTSTNHSQAQQLVKACVNNLMYASGAEISIFEVNKEILDYIHHKRPAVQE